MGLADMMSADRVHERLCALRDDRAVMAFELGRWLLAAKRLRMHVSFGHASFAEYGVWLFGMSPREVRERVRTAEALESLPQMAEALRSGALCWSAVRELTRVADEETEAAWVDAASGRTVRAVERMVRCHRAGDRPTDAPIPDPPRRITMEVSAPTWALFEEMKAALRARQGGHVSDDVLVETMARAVLDGGAVLEQDGARDDGKASYQIALTICESCRTATQGAGGEELVVDEVTVERAFCDGQKLGRVDVSSPARSTQTIAPRVRRAVMRRDKRSCAVPGCTNASFKDVHHVDRQADGGGHDPDNLLVLCGQHHRAVHVGSLVVRGRYSTGFVFEHADGSRYGAPPTSPTRLLALAQTLEALVSLGFKQREAQGMVDRVRADVGEAPRVEDVIRAALEQAPSPGFVGVREERAVYSRIGASLQQAPHPGFVGVREERAVYSRLAG